MERATGIEASPAQRTHSFAIQVLTNCQFGPAGAAEHCFFLELSLKPNLGGMPSSQLVAVKAGIIGQAAFELYGDNIQLAAIMRAASTPIEVNASYANSGNRESTAHYLGILDYGPRRASGMFSSQHLRYAAHPWLNGRFHCFHPEFLSSQVAAIHQKRTAGHE